MDRFQAPTRLEEPNEVGACSGCSGVMYDYELRLCIACCERVHSGCIKECVVCKGFGCRSCMVQDPETLEWKCADC